MNTINERNWQMFYDLRKELGLDKPQPVDLEEKIGVGKGRPGIARLRTKPPKPIQYRKNDPQRPGELPLKTWVQQKAQELKVTIGCVWTRIYDGNLPIPNKRVVNSRVIFVKP